MPLQLKTLHDELKKKSGGNWEKTNESLSEKVVADSSRYEWDSIPVLIKRFPKPVC